MAKRYYCTIQSTPAGKTIWGCGHAKKAAEAEATKEIKYYCELTDDPEECIYANLDTVPTDSKTYAIVSDTDFVSEDPRLHVIDGKLVLTEDPAGAEFGVQHTKSCAYVQSGYNLKVICTCKARFNGKSFARWQEMALENVIYAMFSGASDTRSLPGRLAHDWLLAMARDLNPAIVDRLYQQRDAFQQGMAAVLADVVTP